MGMLTPSLVFSPQKIYSYQFLKENNHSIAFYCVFSYFRPFWAILGVSDVTKRVKIKKNWNFDTIIGFFIPKNISTPILTWKQSFYHLLLCLWFSTISGVSDFTNKGLANFFVGLLGKKKFISGVDIWNGMQKNCSRQILFFFLIQPTPSSIKIRISNEIKLLQ